MHLFSNFNNSKNNILNFLLAMFPLSFIAGNMIININILLLILATFIFYKLKVFEIKFYVLDKLIISFFAFVIFTGFFNFFFHNLGEVSNYLIKSIK